MDTSSTSHLPDAPTLKDHRVEHVAGHTHGHPSRAVHDVPRHAVQHLLNVKKGGLPGGNLEFSSEPTHKGGPRHNVARLDLSRKRLDVCVLADDGTRLATTLCPPDADGLRHLVQEVQVTWRSGPGRDRVDERGSVRPRHLELHGWDVEIADAQKAKGLAPLTCKTDKLDAWVLAELSGTRSRAFDLAPHSRGPRRARAREVPSAPGSTPRDAEEPDPPFSRSASPAAPRTSSVSRAVSCLAGSTSRTPGAPTWQPPSRSSTPSTTRSRPSSTSSKTRARRTPTSSC